MEILSGLADDLTPQARAVVRAFADARAKAPGFILSSGVFPEVNESCSERLLDIIREVASRHLDPKRLDRALAAALLRGARSADSRDEIESALNALLATETTAAYLFGLAAGLSLTSVADDLAL